MKAFIFIALSVFIAPSALADADAERAALARLVHEIDALAPIIDEAQGRADVHARIRFHYDWLRADLARVRHGIAAHINAPRVAPHNVPPLKGDYRNRLTTNQE